MTGELLEVGRVAGDQVVDREDRVAPLEQLADDPAADEPGGARSRGPAWLADLRGERLGDELADLGAAIGTTASDRYAPIGERGAAS